MTGAVMLDVRWPIGGLFTALGLLLGGYGLVTAGDAAHYARSVSVNINLWWGLAMLLFGLLLLAGAARARPLPAGRPSPEGAAVEARERRLGLEDDSGS
jgi:hypothetical protein